MSPVPKPLVKYWSKKRNAAISNNSIRINVGGNLVEGKISIKGSKPIRAWGKIT